MAFPRTRQEAAGTPTEALWETPDNWPRSVRHLSLDDQILGIDPNTNQLFCEGQPLVTEKRWSITERRIAYGGLAIAFVGVAATVAQAIAAFWNVP